MREQKIFRSSRRNRLQPKKTENHFNINQKRNNFVETDTQSLYVIHLNCKLNVKLSDLNFSDKLIFTSTYFFRRQKYRAKRLDMAKCTSLTGSTMKIQQNGTKQLTAATTQLRGGVYTIQPGYIRSTRTHYTHMQYTYAPNICTQFRLG